MSMVGSPGVNGGRGRNEDLSVKKETAEMIQAVVGSVDRAAAIKLQAFVRGAVCRARVSLMVEKLINRLMADRASSLAAAAQKESSGKSPTTEQTGDAGKKAYPVVGVLNSRSGNEKSEQADFDQMKDGVMKKFVGDLLSKYEAKSDPNVPPPVRKWSPVKGKTSPMKTSGPPPGPSDVPPPVRNWPPVNGKPSPMKPTDEKSSAQGPPSGPPPGPLDPHSVRGKKIEHNATRHVISSEEIVHQHEVRIS